MKENKSPWSAEEQDHMELHVRYGGETDATGTTKVPIISCPRDGSRVRVYFRQNRIVREHPGFTDFLEFICEACSRSFITPW